MGFPDENIQITSDLWITYEEKYIIVIQPEDSSLAHSQQPTEQRVRGEGHLPPLHCGRPEHGADMKSWIVLCCRRAAVFTRAYEY